MNTAIAAAAVALGLSVAPSAFAQDAPAAEPARTPAVIQPADTSLTCAAMADEAAQLSATMGGEPDGGLFSRLGGVARAGAAMVIPGAGLAMAGADALTAPEREREEAEAAAVRHRWYYLNGLYAGRDCMNAPAAPPAAAAPAAPASAPVIPGG
ncbi:MAG: hypothetical protein KKE42_02930 [Alphaproteobacteria bacterium]|uniref:hypothetical protein n=1 Tax=Brevundimonas sp. TaxID=1871086 RepID=UPI0017E54EE1|nr:hypothetical protein [Brevundimonas sp.]MBA3050328.1 hypothetical protein [Brevundimonas sp.]MBU3971295.1 hypothetical protein [Alphaproteobacteria bacterium]MBU3972738.1 hypothetical protein [Alphaproteobacteria bacterium]MBU4040045.1 hypothetical protein [Alphaproteobacteria bacterium]